MLRSVKKEGENKMDYEAQYNCNNCLAEYKINPTLVQTDKGAVKWNLGEYHRLKAEYDEAHAEIEAFVKQLKEKIEEYSLQHQKRTFPFFWWKKPDNRFSYTWQEDSWDTSINGLYIWDKGKKAEEDVIQKELNMLNVSDLKMVLERPERKPERFIVCLYCHEKHYFPLGEK